MKKYIAIILAIMLLFSLCGCGDKNTESAPSSGSSDYSQTTAETAPADKSTENSADTEESCLDLTALSGTMVYSEVYNMMQTPSKYKGKKIKMNGAFSVFEDEKTKVRYYSCVIADATACCQQGLEFVLKDERKYPDEYPKLGEEITVVGNFDTYEDEEYVYCHLTDAEIVG